MFAISIDQQQHARLSHPSLEDRAIMAQELFYKKDKVTTAQLTLRSLSLELR